MLVELICSGMAIGIVSELIAANEGWGEELA